MYIPQLIKKYGKNLKLINLCRHEDEVVESFWSYAKPQPWEDPTRKFLYHTIYPFLHGEPTKDAIVRTIRQYHMITIAMQQRWPNKMLVFDMYDLNKEIDRGNIPIVKE